MTPNLISQSYCGLICRNKKLIIALCFVILPLIIVLICMCWKYMLLRWEAKEQEEEAQQRRNKLMEMEDMTVGFKGEKLGEKMADNMMYNQNPLQGKSIAELDDITKLLIRQSQSIKKSRIHFRWHNPTFRTITLPAQHLSKCATGFGF